MVYSEWSFTGLGQIAKLCETLGLRFSGFPASGFHVTGAAMGWEWVACFLFGQLAQGGGVGVVRTLYLKAVPVWDCFCPFSLREAAAAQSDEGQKLGRINKRPSGLQ